MPVVGVRHEITTAGDPRESDPIARLAGGDRMRARALSSLSTVARDAQDNDAFTRGFETWFGKYFRPKPGQPLDVAAAERARELVNLLVMESLAELKGRHGSDSSSLSISSFGSAALDETLQALDAYIRQARRKSDGGEFQEHPRWDYRGPLADRIFDLLGDPQAVTALEQAHAIDALNLGSRDTRLFHGLNNATLGAQTQDEAQAAVARWFGKHFVEHGEMRPGALEEASQALIAFSDAVDARTSKISASPSGKAALRAAPEFLALQINVEQIAHKRGFDPEQTQALHDLTKIAFDAGPENAAKSTEDVVGWIREHFGPRYDVGVEKEDALRAHAVVEALRDAPTAPDSDLSASEDGKGLLEALAKFLGSYGHGEPCDDGAWEPTINSEVRSMTAKSPQLRPNELHAASTLESGREVPVGDANLVRTSPDTVRRFSQGRVDDFDVPYQPDPAQVILTQLNQGLGIK